MEKTNGVEINESIYEFYGSNTFLKIKPSFNIGMVQFAFVTKDKDDKAIKNQSFDCYINIADALSLATEIIFGTLGRKATKEKETAMKKNNDLPIKAERLYPLKVWDSGLGGVNEEKARIRNLRTDGKAVSRQFNIAPGMINMSKPAIDSFVITAMQGPGKTAENGLITPCGQAEATVRVPVMSEKELKNMAEMLQLSIYSYTAGKYAKYYDYGDKKGQNKEQGNNTSPNQNKTQNKAQKQTQSTNNTNLSTEENQQPINNNEVSPKKTKENINNSSVKLPPLQFMVAKTKTPLTPLKNNKENLCMQVVDKDNVVKNVIFMKSDIDNVESNKWHQFVAATSTASILTSFDYIKLEGKETLYFKGFHQQ